MSKVSIGEGAPPTPKKRRRDAKVSKMSKMSKMSIPGRMILRFG